MASPLHGERLARMEERVKELDDRMARVEDKLDSLLELMNKGTGAFWLAASLVGAGFIGVCLQFFRMIFGVHG